MFSMNSIGKLADLLKDRNKIDQQIAGIISRPAEKGHISEWIASKVFSIELNRNRNEKGYDGIFTEGSLKGKKVDIKYYTVNQHQIDLNPEISEDVYLLILTGPHRSASSENQYRQFCISDIYLFNERELCDKLKSGVRVGKATSVKEGYWDRRKIYPENKLDFGLCMKSEALRFFCCKQE